MESARRCADLREAREVNGRGPRGPGSLTTGVESMKTCRWIAYVTLVALTPVIAVACAYGVMVALVTLIP
jgi:hypothetical protein